jgi:NADH-quinone oxidoreductase subunit I
MIGLLKAMKVTLSTLTREPVTVQYPDEHKDLPKRSRGFPTLLWDFDIDEPFCTGCQVCARYCPTSCMSVTMQDNPKFKEGDSKRRKTVDRFYIDYARCMQCNICVEVCNFEAIVMNNTWSGREVSRFDRRDLVFDLEDLLKPSTSGRLPDPFKAPMGIAHHGWAVPTDGEHGSEKAEAPE